MLRYFKIIKDILYYLLFSKSEREIFFRSLKLKFFVGFKKRQKRVEKYNADDVWKSITKDIQNAHTIAVVLSGPSAKNIEFNSNEKHLVICTNNSYRTARKYPFPMIYFLFDHYYSLRYLKIHQFVKNSKVIMYQKEAPEDPGWSRYNKRVESICNKLFHKYEISNEEILISSFVNSELHIKLEQYWKAQFGWRGFRDNSGILMIMLGAYFAETYNKKLYVFGFDMGFGGLVHADSQKAASIKTFVDQSTREEMKSILQGVQALLCDKFIYKSFFPYLSNDSIQSSL